MTVFQPGGAVDRDINVRFNAIEQDIASDGFATTALDRMNGLEVVDDSVTRGGLRNRLASFTTNVGRESLNSNHVRDLDVIVDGLVTTVMVVLHCFLFNC